MKKLLGGSQGFCLRSIIRAHSVTFAAATVFSFAVQVASVDAYALTINNGAIVTVPGDYPSNWAPNEGLAVGGSTDGTLIVENGANVSIYQGGFNIGFAAGGIGKVTISGSGTSLSMSSTTEVKLQMSDVLGSQSFLTVDNGASVSADYFLVGGRGKAEAVFDGVGTTGTFKKIMVGSGDYGGTAIRPDTTGSLVISNGAKITSTTGTVGFYYDSTAYARVTSGADWTMTSTLLLSGANPELVIDDKGTVTSGSTSVQSGIVTIQDSHSKLSTGSFTIGSIIRYSAILNIKNEGTLSSRTAQIGNSTTNIDGAGSQWINTQAWVLSAFDNNYVAAVNLTNNAKLSTGSAVIGQSAANRVYGTHIVTVSSGSTWTNNSTLVVGAYQSQSSQLIVNSGGAVTTDSLTIATSALNATGTVTVTGQHSTLTANSIIDIGRDSGVGTLNISDGGIVRSVNGYVGGNRTVATGITNIDGAGSVWINTADLYVGHTFSSGRVTLTNGALLSTRDGYVGYSLNNTAFNTASVIISSGSSWVNSNSFIVGYTNRNAEVVVDTFGQISSQIAVVGYTNGKGTVTIDGVGSQWTNADKLSIGQTGGTGILNIRNGGVVSSTNSVVGDTLNSIGTVTVTGQGSLLTNSQKLTVANSNSTGEVSIADGGKVESAAGVIGSSAGSDGTVNIGSSVSGATSTWQNTGELIVADADTSKGIINISSGGHLESVTAIIGVQSGSDGTVNVDGANALWTLSDKLTVADAGTGTVNVRSGGQTTHIDAVIGAQVGAQGTVNVDGSGSLWATMNDLVVADAGQGELNITNAGQVNSTNATAGQQVGSEANILVTGNSSTWSNTADLTIADAGKATLNIEQEGFVSSDNIHVGQAGFSEGQVLISNNSSLTTTADMLVGIAGTGHIEISSAGRIHNDGIASLGVGAGGTGTMLITDSGSTWSSDGLMTVGVDGHGELTLRDDGVAKPSDGKLYVAVNSGSTGIINIGAAAGEVAENPGSTTAATIQFGDGEGRVVFNHTSDNYTFSPMMSGAGAVDVYAGTTVLMAANDYTGDTTIYSGTFKAGGESVFSQASLTDIRTDGTLDMAGYNQTIDRVNNAGWIYVNTRSGAPGSQLTVGNYRGDGGNLRLNTALAGNDSPTDQLVITGSATGQTLLHINNTGGIGGYTTGDGIMIIKAVGDATTSTDAFYMLGNRVAAGAYEYSLHRGGSGGEQNWYLRNTLPEIETTEKPDYRVEFPLAASIIPVAQEYGFAMIGTLHARVGDYVVQKKLAPVTEARIIRGENDKKQVAMVEVAPSGDRQDWFEGSWGRLTGDHGSRKVNNFEQRGADYDYTMASLQAGLDIYGRETASGSKDKAGVYVGYGKASSNVNGAYDGEAGTISMDAYTVGAYWTHYSSQGWYTDLVAQSTWYNTEANSVLGPKLKSDGHGVVFSAETGYSIKLSNSVTVEPQAQIAYQHVSFDKITDTYGKFLLTDSETLRGRLGVRATKEWNVGTEASPRLIKGWLRANVWHEFMGNSKTSATNLQNLDPVTVKTSLGGTWGEIGAGVSGQVSDKASLFVTGAYNRLLDNNGREAWSGRIGVNVMW
ncbi:autotransporter outer membrane beta-barrel domain-containing protein [Microvirga sp. W0021]|uniref:Autotransporter outer membrane beta-barrel domain-containing protein n=1 Tax=Hohaiivirga grylli TaxID=3133970 RepID=A0ABV0BJY4_9HYPH